MLCFLRTLLEALTQLPRWSVVGLLVFAPVVTSCSPIQYGGGEVFDDPKAINASHQGKRVLLHMKSGLKPDDSQPCVAFNMAAGFVESGYDVVILIDAGGTGDFLGKTPEASKWGRYRLPRPMVEAVAAELGLSAADFPETYMGYLSWLSDRGAKVHMNATMNILSKKATSVRNQPAVPSFIHLSTFPEMAKLAAEADIYMAY